MSDQIQDRLNFQMNAESIEELFQQGLERYKAGESAADLIPIYQKICDRQPKVASGWICLAWLYLLDDQGSLAFKAAQKAVKLSPEDPQAHINLAIAMLETSQAGVRGEIEAAQNWLMIISDAKTEIMENFEEGNRRRPNWKNLEKIKNWLLEGV
jgi:cytochrome c-type biogenesis protein CcmH/NrfG